jgi:hypothetical protein
MNWGTSLCWWANINYPPEVKTQLMDLLFGCRGLGLKVARYNLGGGYDSTKKQNMRAGAAVPCILKNGVYDINLDKYQLEVLDEAVKRGVNQVELFCNSPPWWMTKSGFTNGSDKSFECNLRPECIDEFVDYLVKCYHIFKERYPVVSLSPFNEPSNPFWTTNVNQEGCFYNYKTRKTILKKIKEKSPDIIVAACDEFSSGFALAWYIGSPKKLIDRINVHSYRLAWKNITFYFDDFSIWRFMLRKMNRKPVWMSEFGYGYGDAFKDNLKLARHIFRDLKTIRPRAWVYWQAVENLGWSDWGLIQVDFNDPKEIKISKQYYILKHFSKTLCDDDKYNVISQNMIEITNEDAKQIKYILLNDSNSEINAKMRLDTMNVIECRISNTDKLFVDYSDIQGNQVKIPANSLMSIIAYKS